MRIGVPRPDDPELNVAPLIDMVFLLLVYFMVTASLVKSEADLGIRLPGMVQQAQTVDMPDEQIIEITETGCIFLNGRQYDSATSEELPELLAVLRRYRTASGASRNEAMITIAAHDTCRQQRVIDVMNCCAAAGIENVTFSSGDDG
ncbi:MAG: biopolymer transporter ExbD [Lentisphaeria bacterium]|nr:biopolymer transporter ExbD [Lentisphaeria bacterium]